MYAPVRAGSCWAFSTTGSVEGAYQIANGDLVSLSEEDLVQCDHNGDNGCQGGLMDNAFAWVETNGIASESAYPYTSGSGTTGSCKSSLPSTSCSISGYKTVSGESSMASYVQSTGPLSVCLDANNFNSYTSGVMSVCGTSVDHCVQAVGVDTASGYWKVRNSWGTSWGESGFIQLEYGKNLCDLASEATYVDAEAM